MYLLARIAVISVVLFGLAGCGGDSAKTDESSTTTVAVKSSTEPQPGTRIEISNYQFKPLVLQARVGDTITVKNLDSAEHTVTAVDKSFDTGPLEKDQEATFKVTTAGTYNYICSIHPYMAATLTVVA